MPQAQAVPLAPAEFFLDYMPCGCIGTMTGRVCRKCFSAHFLKRCQDCLGQGKIEKTPRQRGCPARTERCGRCMGTGWVPCPLKDVADAERWWREQETAEAAENQSAPTPQAAALPPPAATAKRISARRTQIKQTRKRRGRLPLGGEERVQNPLEAMELAQPGEEIVGDVLPGAEAAAKVAREMTQEDLRPVEEVVERAPSSFSPNDLPPAA